MIHFDLVQIAASLVLRSECNPDFIYGQTSVSVYAENEMKIKERKKRNGRIHKLWICNILGASNFQNPQFKGKTKKNIARKFFSDVLGRNLKKKNWKHEREYSVQFTWKTIDFSVFRLNANKCIDDTAEADRKAGEKKNQIISRDSNG